MIDRACEECGAPLRGRIDKRFCSDQCRSTHNNRRNWEPNRYVREINTVLRRNRRILDSLNPGGKVKVAAARLKERGFDFRYHTTVSHVREGGLCYYCYDQGYVPLEKNYYLLLMASPRPSPEERE
jgi:hypothetical protein